MTNDPAPTRDDLTQPSWQTALDIAEDETQSEAALRLALTQTAGLLKFRDQQLEPERTARATLISVRDDLEARLDAAQAALMEERETIRCIGEWLDEEKTMREQVVATLREIGCLGGHFCPGNPSFLGDVWSEEGEYDPSKWPLCLVCTALRKEQP